MLGGGKHQPAPASSSASSAPNKGLALFDEMLTKALVLAEEQCLEFAKTTDLAVKYQILNRWELALKECLQMKKSYLMELSQVKTVVDKLKFRACLEAYDLRIERNQQDLKYQRTLFEKAQLLPKQGAAPGSSQDTNQMVSETKQVQDKTFQSLGRIKTRMTETVEIGQKAAQDLEAQGDTIKRIHEGVNEVNDEIAKANQILTSIMRRIATDKVVLCFCFILTLLVIAVIVLFATGTINPPVDTVPG